MGLFTNSPTIVIQPRSVTTTLGSTVRYTVAINPGDSKLVFFNWAKSNGTLPTQASGAHTTVDGYQSTGGGVAAPGSGNPYTSTLQIPEVGAEDLGFYECQIVDAFGNQLRSAPAALATADLGTGLSTPGTGTGGGFVPPVYLPLPPADPDVTLDGDWSSALPSGAPLVTYPFLNEGDAVTKIVRQPVQADLRSRAALPPGTPYRYDGTANAFYNTVHGNTYSFDEGESRDMGGHLGEWIRSYASLPPKRVVPESFVHNFQYYGVSGGDGGSSTYTLKSLTRKVSSRVVYEYFLAKDAASFPVLLKPEIILDNNFFQKIGDGVLDFSRTRPLFVTTDGADFIAEDSEIKIWHGVILYRKTRYIDGPTDDLWGTALTVPTVEPSP